MKKNMLAGMFLVAAFAVTLASCGVQKGAAEAAIKAAEDAYNNAKASITAALPEDAKKVEEAISAAKADVEKGDYKAAMAAIKDVPTQVTTLNTQAAEKVKELEASWQGLNANLPAAVTALQGKVDKMAKMKKLPAGMDATKFDAAKASLTTATDAWTAAQAAQQSGNWAEAVAKGNEAKAATVEGMNSVGMPVPDALK